MLRCFGFVEGSQEQMVRHDIASRSRRGPGVARGPSRAPAVLVALLAVALLPSPAQSRDVNEVFGVLFETDDEQRGITLPAGLTRDDIENGRNSVRRLCDAFFSLRQVDDDGEPTPFRGFIAERGDGPFGLEDPIAPLCRPVDDLRLTSVDGVPGYLPTTSGGFNFFDTPPPPSANLDALDPQGFAADSIRQFEAIGARIEREIVRPRLKPFLASWVYDTEEDVLTLADPFLGPLLAERATTLGKGRVAIGFSYRQLDYTKLNGQPLDSFSLTIAHRDEDGNGVLEREETDVIDVTLDLFLEQKVIDLFLEWGITNSFDLGIALPLYLTQLELRGNAAIRFVGDPNDPTWTESLSEETNFFCRQSDNQVPIRISPSQQNNFTCPGGNDRGDRAATFRSGATDTKTERAFGIGDLRLRGKWHAIERSGLVPDVAFVTELKPPTGKENDFHGTGSLSSFNYLVVQNQIWRFMPHLNAGIEISAGGDFQDAVEWIVGTDILVTDWLGVSVDQLSRVPFDDTKVSPRHEIGVGIKLHPARDVMVFFDSVWPLNDDQGLVTDRTWRVGGMVTVASPRSM